MKQQKILLHENSHVLIVEDHQLMKTAQLTVMRSSFPQAVVHVPCSIKEVKQFLDSYQYDAIILDNSLTLFPDGKTCTGMDLIPLIREKNPGAKLVFNSTSEAISVMLFRQNKVDAWVPKGAIGNVFVPREIM